MSLQIQLAQTFAIFIAIIIIIQYIQLTHYMWIVVSYLYLLIICIYTTNIKKRIYLLYRIKTIILDVFQRMQYLYCIAVSLKFSRFFFSLFFLIFKI